MVNFPRYRKVFLVVVALLSLSMCMSSCEPLRKKFTRQKKKQTEDQDFVPVLEPMDYPAPENNPGMNYRRHYALIQVWYKDLWTALDEKYTDKKTKHTIHQIYSHIDEMRKLISDDKQAELDKLKGCLSYFDHSLDGPLPLRNVPRIQSDLRAFHRQLRAKLRFDAVKRSFVNAAKQKT